MIDCPFYYVYENDTPPEPTELDEEDSCVCRCNCGYLTFESLIPFLDEIQQVAQRDPAEYVKLEIKLRKLILGVSRIFDADVGVESGFYSTSHVAVKTVQSTGRYLKVPPFVKGTVEVFGMDNVQIASNLFGTKGEYVLYMPCANHGQSCCKSSCWSNGYRNPLEWPRSCYKVRARWGYECADEAVEIAVREYVMALLKKEEFITSGTGLEIKRGFKSPVTWEKLVESYRRKRNIHSRYGIA